MTLLYVIDLQNYGDLEVQFLFVEGLGGDSFQEGCKIAEAMGHAVVMTCPFDYCLWMQDNPPLKWWEYVRPSHLFQNACQVLEDGSVKVLKDVYERTKVFDAISTIYLNMLLYRWRIKYPEDNFVSLIEAHLEERHGK